MGNPPSVSNVSREPFTAATRKPGSPIAFLAGGGEMGERLRTKDWSKTPLGPPENWPQSLKTAVRIMLTSRQAIWVGWGPELVYLYNDPYRSIIGGRHPAAFGCRVEDVWIEIWDVIGPMLATAMTSDEGTYVESQLLIMERHGYREETYYTFSYSPIPNDDGTTGGIICANTDDTRRVIGERQLALLRELAAATVNPRSWREAAAGTAEALALNAQDLPWAVLFSSEPGSAEYSVAEVCGIGRDHPAATASSWPLAEASKAGQILVVENISTRFERALPSGAWDEPPSRAAIISLSASAPGVPGALLVVGLNPFRIFDQSYENFLGLVGGQIAAGLASGLAYEQERRRAEALAELDRAKTEFFSNVSHEFRTPLTLMLGPVEDLLEKSYTDLTPATKSQLEIVHRNSLRLLKLVNTMLDFSRIEAGRVEANYAAVDLAAFTADLASVFRAAIERAGLRLIVQCPPLPQPVFVDRDMWEKIVLNLLSNAFKFTLEGEIEIRLEAVDGTAQLTVRDTGVGIPESDLQRVFERFHRVRESRGRTHEGTGIGLALVQELVRIHSGVIRVESVLNQGTQFIVSIPLGRDHLEARRIRALPDRAPGNLAAAAFAHEALRWVPEHQESADRVDAFEHSWARAGQAALGPRITAGSSSPILERPRIVWADDNADMRDYVARLLSERFAVTAAADGQAALEAIRRDPPELVLSDVMMPRLDGFGLLKALRADQKLSTIPVILLSARAGEEARVEGVEAGADDYLVKPFSARELLARVDSYVKMARFRREASAALHESESRFKAIFDAASIGVCLVDPSTGRFQTVNRALADMLGYSLEELLGLTWREVTFPDDLKADETLVQRVLAREIPSYTIEKRYLRKGGSTIWISLYGTFIWDASGTPRFGAGVIMDISERRRTDQILRENEDRLRATNTELEQRLRELEHANREITISRRAAMNLMQDAVSARAEVEKLNQKLRGEISEREEAYRRVRQRTAQFETLLNQAPIGVYVVDADFRIRDVNPRARPTFGEVVDLIGRDFDEVIHILWPTKFADEVAQIFRHTLATGESYSSAERVEHRADRDSTEYYEWRTDRIPLPDGRWGVVCYFRDISEQVKTRQAIETSEERYRSLVSVITDVPWTTDADGNFVTPQAAWEAYTGQTWEQHRNLGWVEVIHPDDRASLIRDWDIARKTAHRYSSRGRFWNAGSHEWRHFEVKAAPLRGADGVIREWVGSCTDIETRIRAEEDLKFARDQALAANRAKDEFLATLSHELRTPLNPVLLVASEAAADDSMADATRADFKMIADNVSLQARLIDDLLDFNRIIRGKLMLERQALDMHNVLRDAAATIRDEIAAKKLNLSFGLAAEVHSVHGDPVRLRQVFWNVLKNAVKFTPNGGSIDIATRNLDDDELIEIRVRDSGIGMEPTEIAKIFEPFVQGRHANPEGPSYGGLGLGLAISRMLVEGHSGTIGAESDGLERGTTIVVTLPVSTVTTASGFSSSGSGRHGAHSRQEATAKSRRILFVEDHGPTRTALAHLLSRRGYEVTAAGSIADALGHARTETFDVLVSDLGLPDGDGCTLMRELRKVDPHLPGIAISGYGMDNDLARSRESGFGEHLTKPVSIDSLERAFLRLFP